MSSRDWLGLCIASGVRALCVEDFLVLEYY